MLHGIYCSRCFCLNFTKKALIIIASRWTQSDGRSIYLSCTRSSCALISSLVKLFGGFVPHIWPPKRKFPYCFMTTRWHVILIPLRRCFPLIGFEVDPCMILVALLYPFILEMLFLEVCSPSLWSVLPFLRSVCLSLWSALAKSFLLWLCLFSLRRNQSTCLTLVCYLLYSPCWHSNPLKFAYVCYLSNGSLTTWDSQWI